jgi:hypothetical protein
MNFTLIPFQDVNFGGFSRNSPGDYVFEVVSNKLE